MQNKDNSGYQIFTNKYFNLFVIYNKIEKILITQ